MEIKEKKLSNTHVGLIILVVIVIIGAIYFGSYNKKTVEQNNLVKNEASLENTTNSGSGSETKAPVDPAKFAVVNISVDKDTVNSGTGTTIRWSTDKAVSCKGGATNEKSSWNGPKETSGSFNTGPLNVTTNFFISCMNSDNIETQTGVVVNVKK